MKILFDEQRLLRCVFDVEVHEYEGKDFSLCDASEKTSSHLGAGAVHTNENAPTSGGTVFKVSGDAVIMVFNIRQPLVVLEGLSLSNTQVQMLSGLPECLGSERT
jgi:hypothetical protein